MGISQELPAEIRSTHRGSWPTRVGFESHDGQVIITVPGFRQPFSVSREDLRQMARDPGCRLRMTLTLRAAEGEAELTLNSLLVRGFLAAEDNRNATSAFRRQVDAFSAHGGH